MLIKESKQEDFTRTMGETINVSTIHKAKGKEFDNVFLMLDGFALDSDEKKPQNYVSVTRAKQKLIVHLNRDFLDDLFCEDIQKEFDYNAYQPSDLLVLQLSHKDVWRDFFIARQQLLSNYKSGDPLQVDNDGCYDEKGNCVVKFSGRFKDKILGYENKGYRLKGCQINYVVYRYKEEMEKEFKIILPELKFQKREQIPR